MQHVSARSFHGQKKEKGKRAFFVTGQNVIAAAAASSDTAEMTTTSAEDGKHSNNGRKERT